MGKVNKEEEARRSGMAYALKIITDAKAAGSDDTEAIEKLKEELRYRNITKAPLMIPRSEVVRFQEENKSITVATIGIMACMTLRDEFEWGHDRIARFLDRFNKKTDVLLPDDMNEVTWKDYQEILLDEVGIDIGIPGYDPDTNDIKR